MGDYYFAEYWIDVRRNNIAIEFVRDGQDVRVIVHASRATEDYRQFCLHIAQSDWFRFNRELEQAGCAGFKTTVRYEYWELSARRAVGRLFLKLNCQTPTGAFTMRDELVLPVENLDQAVS